jgi:NhaP-type Na+/H+ or K+/H+ antiporter
MKPHEKKALAITLAYAAVRLAALVGVIIGIVALVVYFSFESKMKRNWNIDMPEMRVEYGSKKCLSPVTKISA